jgi:hypothetical protein
LRQSLRPQAKRARWGGRRKALLSLEEEQEFLAPWTEQAKQAGVLVAFTDPRASVMWRMLARHGWRKVAPDNAPSQERSGGLKKTPPNAGCRPPRSPVQGARGATDVPRGSTLWPHGTGAALLGAWSLGTGDAQRL